MADQRSIDQFRKYLRIKCVHPNPDYEESIQFIVQYLKDFGIEAKIVQLPSNFQAVLATIVGSEPEKPSILLNSHMDVVPVEVEHWDHEPFAAHMDEKGDIYARGTQDMKCVTIQFIEAVGRMREQSVKTKRTVHLSFVPHEEVGGAEGMCEFVKTKEFQDLNVGVAIDEGLASPTAAYTVFYGERSPMWIRVKATGNVGHGSRFVENTAVIKLHEVCGKFLKYREEQQKILEDSQKQKKHRCKTLGDVTTLNLTNIRAGNGSVNVVPGEAEAMFDIRIAPTVNLKEFLKQLDDWTDVDGVSYDVIQSLPDHYVSTIDSNDKWWSAFANTFQELNIDIEPEIFPAATDSRFLRQIGLPAYGFSPMRNTPILLHDHNERLNKDVFVEGIPVYQRLITNLANVD